MIETGADVDERALTRTHAQSLLVSMLAGGLLAVQNLAVVFVIDRRELGLLGIASGIGSIALVAQYFGVSAATLKEVAVAPDRSTAFHRMVAGLAVRLALSLPIVVALVAGASWISTSVYDYPELETPLLLVGLIVVLYGFTDIFGYTLQGLRLWQRFFAVKLLGAAVQLPIVIGGAALWGVNGYFGGSACAAGLGVLISLVGVGSVFRLRHAMPGARLVWSNARRMIGLGVAAHLAKIFQVLVLQAPVLIAGYWYTAAVTGDVKFAITIVSFVVMVSGAVNTVNISVFSRRFAAGEGGFWEGVRRQTALYSLVIGLVTAVVALATPDLLGIIAGGEYETAEEITVLAVAGGAFYGLLGIIVSTAHIPAGAYARFVATYAVPAVVTAVCSAIVAATGGDVALIGGSLLLGSAVGLIMAMIDLWRRSAASAPALIGLAGMVAISLTPLLDVPHAVRYGLLAAALTAACVLFLRTRAAAAPA